MKGTGRSFVGEVEGSEIVHDFDEFVLVGDRNDRIRAIVLRDGSDVRPFRSLAERNILVFLLPLHLRFGSVRVL